MKIVWIMSYYFAPLNVIAAKRYGTMCKYMENYGYKPYVISVNNCELKTFDAESDLEIPIPSLQVIRIGNSKSCRLVKNHVVSFLSGMFLTSKSFSRCFSQMDYRWLEEIKIAYKKGVFDKIEKPDLILGTFPPVGNLYGAHYLSRKYKVPYIAEIRDLMSQYEETKKGMRQLKLFDRLAEYYLLNSSNAIVAVTDGYKKILKELYKKPTAVVYNGWDRKIEAEENICSEDTCYLYYAGSLYEHRINSLKLLLKALLAVNQSDSIKMIIRSIGPDYLTKQLSDFIKLNKLTSIVELKAACEEKVVLQEQRNAMINIILSDVEDKEFLLSTIPGKVFELIAEKPPVLVIASPKSEIKKILDRTKKGTVTNDLDKIIEYIRQGHRDSNSDSRWINYYKRENQAKRLCKFFDEILYKLRK